MSSRLNWPRTGGGRFVPSGVVTTLTACPPAKNEYCPPEIDAIYGLPRMALRDLLLPNLKCQWLRERHQQRRQRNFSLAISPLCEVIEIEKSGLIPGLFWDYYLVLFLDNPEMIATRLVPQYIKHGIARLGGRTARGPREPFLVLPSRVS